ncbi:hypothetical protein [Cellulomonas uda]|uniref:Uncharacterized protein n=1 Tax=Cellulomonas uda TaxID=1714 RepID=A0A4Y3K5X9_CELUD|nr:hypothetical protein [Cellulomonas uda]NII67832.1 hypothetical protein [Cellulomonas uda]GEA79921.1 hypothetical protein CUD01_03650 [Cellulomonas uda]
MSLGYAYEKLSATVSSLADSEGTLRDRLLNAWTSQGVRTPVVDGGAVFPDLARRLDALHKRMSSVREGSEGWIAATVAAMTEEDARAVVREMLELASIVTELHWRDVVRAEVENAG